MHPPILNIADVELQPRSHGERFAANVGLLAPEIAEYPDSGKFQLVAQEAGGKPGLLRFVQRLDTSLDCRDGE